MKIDNYRELYELYKQIFYLYKIKELPNLNGHEDFCRTDHKTLYLYNDKHYQKKFKSWIDDSSIFNTQCNVLVSEIDKKIIEITESNFTDDHFFLLFYYYFVCFYNNLESAFIQENVEIFLIKYDKKITYSICDNIYQSNNMKYTLYFKKLLIDEYNPEYQKNIKDIKTSYITDSIMYFLV